jgi:hypothetical protein
MITVLHDHDYAGLWRKVRQGFSDRSSDLHEASDRRFDLARFREPAGLVLAECRHAVDHDVKHTAGALDQCGIGAESLLQVGRQTGGPRVVVSNHAVGDGDIHGSLLVVLRV